MQHSDLHRHIITTAGNLFYTKGYNSTGINEIIAACGIAKATLYSHFRSKEDIYIAHLEQRHEGFMTSLKSLVAQEKKGKHQLLAIFDLLREMYLKEDFHGCWVLNTLGELSPQQTKLLRVIQEQKKALLSYLEEIVKANVPNISKAEIEKISAGIYLLYESAMTESSLFKNDWPIFMAKSLVRGLVDLAR